MDAERPVEERRTKRTERRRKKAEKATVRPAKEVVKEMVRKEKAKERNTVAEAMRHKPQRHLPLKATVAVAVSGVTVSSTAGIRPTPSR